jgi:hypothetical protein
LSEVSSDGAVEIEEVKDGLSVRIVVSDDLHGMLAERYEQRNSSTIRLRNREVRHAREQLWS